MIAIVFCAILALAAAAPTDQVEECTPELNTTVWNAAVECAQTLQINLPNEAAALKSDATDPKAIPEDGDDDDDDDEEESSEEEEDERRRREINHTDIVRIENCMMELENIKSNEIVIRIKKAQSDANPGISSDECNVLTLEHIVKICHAAKH